MKKSIIAFFAFLGVQSGAFAQAYDGYGDLKVFLGYTNIGGNSGIEYQNNLGVNDLFSWGTQVTYLFSTKEKEAVGIENGFKFIDKIDVGCFLRFHFLETLKLPKNVDVFLGGDASVHSLGVHTGFKYNFTEKIGVYGMYKQGLSSIMGESFSLSEDENGNPIPDFFAKKAAISVGITINMNNW
ncbi:hypothetical protein P3875_08210 [Myroides sp. JBRI-B21084]|uniref:DUF6646 family protein n=1 Tax=Myroides sp. JBRI-B21084 TaxID=3119977 RepID=UPI0026E17F7F|nr:DUF6646 family protein [Paenimyroides cloacae]WKW45769.1 hypothetical protein P3875_08210 [Paenimyroides cloacae]